MKITVNGDPCEVTSDNLNAALAELGYDAGRVATALNEAFIPVTARDGHPLSPGDRLEVLAPMQGG